MYEPTYWVDEVVDQSGQIIQMGTNYEQGNMNKLEKGVSDAMLAANFLMFKAMQDGYEQNAEVKDVTLAMDSLPWPFNNKLNTVALAGLRENTHYQVDVSVLSYSGGELGRIEVLDKAKNGFKLLHDGSATSVALRLRITGGMTA